jgi:DNA-binding transcriptional MerR regulator
MHRMEQLTTQAVADRIGVTKRTLLRWLHLGKVQEPRRIAFGGIAIRIWTPKDVAKAKKYRETSFGLHIDRKEH